MDSIPYFSGNIQRNVTTSDELQGSVGFIIFKIVLTDVDIVAKFETLQQMAKKQPHLAYVRDKHHVFHLSVSGNSHNIVYLSLCKETGSIYVCGENADFCFSHTLRIASCFSSNRKYLNFLAVSGSSEGNTISNSREKDLFSVNARIEVNNIILIRYIGCIVDIERVWKCRALVKKLCPVISSLIFDEENACIIIKLKDSINDSDISNPCNRDKPKYSSSLIPDLFDNKNKEINNKSEIKNEDCDGIIIIFPSGRVLIHGMVRAVEDDGNKIENSINHYKDSSHNNTGFHYNYGTSIHDPFYKGKNDLSENHLINENRISYSRKSQSRIPVYEQCAFPSSYTDLLLGDWRCEINRFWSTYFETWIPIFYVTNPVIFS